MVPCVLVLIKFDAGVLKWLALSSLLRSFGSCYAFKIRIYMFAIATVALLGCATNFLLRLLEVNVSLPLMYGVR